MATNDVDYIKNSLTDLGVIVLSNEEKSIEKDGEKIEELE